MNHRCLFCANTTIIAFQDEKGFVQIGNLTSDGWQLKQLGPALEPAMGTGLALDFSVDGTRIHLYCQTSTLNMSEVVWDPEPSDGFSLSTIILPPVSC